MTGRRFLLGALVFLAGATAGGGVVLACAGAPRQTAQVLLDLRTDELRASRTRVHANLDSWEPDAESGRHRHPGPTILYVLEGELTAETAEGTRTLKPGDLLWHPGNHEHNVRNRTPRMARALAVHLDPLGASKRSSGPAPDNAPRRIPSGTLAVKIE
jgi:mannose-6-phosphate isomerase-like protein (cupin superfamily)